MTLGVFYHKIGGDMDLLTFKTKNQDMVTDICSLLYRRLQDSEIKFSMCGQHLFVEDIFSRDAALPLFLYNKQQEIDAYLDICNRQKNESADPLIAQIKFIPDDLCMLGFYPIIIHNISSPPIYYSIMSSICHSITMEKSLQFDKENKTIILDNLYSNMCYALNTSPNLLHIEIKKEDKLKPA